MCSAVVAHVVSPCRVTLGCLVLVAILSRLLSRIVSIRLTVTGSVIDIGCHKLVVCRVGSMDDCLPCAECMLVAFEIRQTNVDSVGGATRPGSTLY